MRGCNAATVGVLGAAFLDPVLARGVTRPTEALAAIAGIALVRLRAHPLAIVALGRNLA